MVLIRNEEENKQPKKYFVVIFCLNHEYLLFTINKHCG